MEVAMADIQNDIDIEEKFLSEEDDTPILPPENIFTYTEQRSCYDIYRMLKESELCKDPYYQRNVVWKNPQMTRFIDSLIKRLPIPSLCFSLDSNERYYIIDGKQRTTTILEFLKENSDWQLSELDDIDPRISGKTVKEIKDNEPTIYSAIKNVTLPINMVKCDYSKKNNMEYIYKIFHRLNTGGVSLNNQEIRNCIYAGDLIDLLNECNNNSNWKTWLPQIAEDNRLKGQERILVFFACFDSLDNYGNKLNAFLNDYAYEHKQPEEKWVSDKKLLFKKTIAIAKNIQLTANKNVYIDAVLYGIAKNIDVCSQMDNATLQNKYTELMSTPYFEASKLSQGTTKHLSDRLESAEKIFGTI